MTLRSWLGAPARLSFAFALFALASLVAPAPAHAFCRTITAPVSASYDPNEGCYQPPSGTGYIPLWWSNACVGFSVQQDASKDIPWATADSIAQSAFAKWSAASCGSGAPSIQAQDEGAVACDRVQYSETGPNQHTIMFRDANWPHSDQYNTLALTTVTFDTDTGEILDADMEINTAQHLIVTKTPVPSGSYDLESIITHEAGHFLGLAHSPDDSAVMYWQYKPGSTTLTADDVGGVCSIYLPNGDRVTDQNQSGTVNPVSVQQASCNATPLGGFGTECGPLGAPASSGGCTVAAAAGVNDAGPTQRNAIVFGVILLALAIARRRATLLGMRRLNGIRAIVTCCVLGVAGATLAGIAAEREAQASVVITVLFDELVRDSTAAALVTPMEQQSVWENGRIYTFTRVHVDRSVAGVVENDPWIRTMGGVVGKIGQLVDGEAVLTVGRPGLLFIQPLTEEGPGVYVVTARAQGQFPIVLDAQKTERFVRASGVGAEVPTPRERVVQISRSRAMSGMASGAPLATDVLHKRPIEDGVRDVTAAWARIHGSH
jgi:hypothetical protein